MAADYGTIEVLNVYTIRNTANYPSFRAVQRSAQPGGERLESNVADTDGVCLHRHVQMRYLTRCDDIMHEQSTCFYVDALLVRMYDCSQSLFIPQGLHQCSANAGGIVTRGIMFRIAQS